MRSEVQSKLLPLKIMTDGGTVPEFKSVKASITSKGIFHKSADPSNNSI